MKRDLHALLRLHSDAAPRPWHWSEKLPREVFIPAETEDGVGREVVFYRTKHAVLAADAVNSLPRLIEIAMVAKEVVDFRAPPCGVHLLFSAECRACNDEESAAAALDRLRAALTATAEVERG